MTIHPDVDALLKLVRAEHRGEERMDWTAVEAALGTSLPSDYMSFIDTYGVGDIEELTILPPLPVDVPNLSDCHIGGMSEGLRRVWETEGGVPGVSVRPESLLPWGTGCNANELAWLMTGSDPDSWPVVAWRRQVSYGESRWAIFDCGMVEFLTRMMLAEFDTCPLGDASLWGRPGAFVSWREQHRRLVAGLDPLTGEPDPYAEMYPISDDD